MGGWVIIATSRLLYRLVRSPVRIVQQVVSVGTQNLSNCGPSGPSRVAVAVVGNVNMDVKLM